MSSMSKTQRLDAIFALRYGHSFELNGLKQVEAPCGVNFVSRAMGNNGVTARVAVDVTPAQAGELSVALSGNGVLSTFLQPEPFVCGYHVMILTARDPAMTTVEKLWWARCIWSNRYRFSYGRQANRTLASLAVPASVPNWVQSMHVPTHEGLTKAAGPTTALTDPTGKRWRNFQLNGLFEVRKGKRLTKADMVPGATRFIGASEKNNGVTAHIDQLARHPAGVLTVVYNGNSTGYAFYQPEPFCASDDVNVLYPKVVLDKWSLLFIAAVIRHGRTRYTYGYKWTMTRMQATKIRLPATAGGAPDFAYMTAFMRSLPFSAALEHRTQPSPEV